MSIKGFFTPRGSVTRRVGSIAAMTLLAMAVSGARAFADNCIEDVTEANDPNRVPLGCTANDFGVGSVTVTQLLDDGCQSAGDSFSFDGILNITAESGGNADRYDIGFYIGADGEQALRGTCAVADLPTGRCTGGDGTTACNVNADCVVAGGTCVALPDPPNDGDQCGDYVGDSIVHSPIFGVTAKCVDQDGDGFFDLAICTSYDNNAGGTCTGTADTFPSTKSKCRCSVVNTNQEIPHCDTNADCPTDNNICTNEVCVGLQDQNADFFGCQSQPNTDPCEDNLFCNGADTCVDGTCSGHAGDPCPGGSVCSSCNEAADNCFTAGGTACRLSSGVCDPAELCTGTSTDCPSNTLLPTSQQCRAAANTVCDVPEFCTGTGGACPGDQFQPSTLLCRATNGVCDVPENCTGTNGNCPSDGFKGTVTVCRDSAGQCDLAENCTGTNGNCPTNGFKTSGTTCTDDLFCTNGDICDGLGSCLPGPPQNCDDGVDCTVDTCNEVQDGCDHAADDAFCDDDDECTLDTCNVLSGCVSALSCADICRSPGYWATHSGYEKEGSTNIAQELLKIVGNLSVCGETISATSNQDSPYLDGLKLTSDLEGLCMRTKGVLQRQLYRQLVAALLNCAVSGGAGHCDQLLAKYIDVSFDDCSDVCAGNPPAVDPPSVGDCIGQLDCFNNGGQVVSGKCATGTCESQPELVCGGEYGSCPDFNALPQACIAFANNCHAQEVCNEGLGFCPKKTPASSSSACREARFNECTIDSCP